MYDSIFLIMVRGQFYGLFSFLSSVLRINFWNPVGSGSEGSQHNLDINQRIGGILITPIKSPQMLHHLDRSSMGNNPIEKGITPTSQYMGNDISPPIVGDILPLQSWIKKTTEYIKSNKPIITKIKLIILSWPAEEHVRYAAFPKTNLTSC